MGAAVLAIVGSTAIVSSTALAQTTTDPHTNMIQKLAQKLGVPEDKVKVAFDQIHSEHKAEMEQMMEGRLNNLVSEGKITDAQKSAIQAKMSELRAQMEANKESFKNLTPEEHKAKMEAQKTELDNWAKSQGIDPSYLFFKMKFDGGHHGMGMRNMMWDEGQQQTDGQ